VVKPLSSGGQVEKVGESRMALGTIRDLLERSDEVAALEQHFAAVTAESRGRLVLVRGEAHLARPLTNASCERIDLKIGDPQRCDATRRLPSIA